MSVAADELLEADDALGDAEDGVFAVVGVGGVGLFALDGDDDVVGGGEEGAGAGADDADGELGPAVEAEHLFDLGAEDLAVEGAVLAHGVAAGAAFFGGLEDEVDAAGAVLELAEDACAPRRMAVWPSWPQACMTPGVVLE